MEDLAEQLAEQIKKASKSLMIKQEFANILSPKDYEKAKEIFGIKKETIVDGIPTFCFCGLVVKKDISGKVE